MDAIKVKLIGLSRGGGGNLQPDKTVTPTEQEQIVRPDPGYDGLRQVTVEAIPDQYADVSGVDAGAGDVRVGKVIVGSDGETITGTMPPQKPEEIGHATPTEQAQTVTPTAGSVFSAVEVAAIPSEYADVSGVDATAADVRTGKTIVDAQGDTVTGEMEPQKPEQVKSATPTTSPQSVTPDTGYALSRVDVDAIPSEYADVSDVTATAGTVLTGSDFVDASGTLVHGACDYDADTSDADATAGQIEAGATAYVGGEKVTGTKPIRTTDVEISDLSPVPIPAGSYDGTVKARLADPTEVDPAIIAQGHSILGVNGTLVAQDNLPALLNNTLTSVSDSTLAAVSDCQFYKKTALESANFPAATSIGNQAFYQCSALESANFPAATSIGNQEFYQCSALESANFPAATSIGYQAFYQCSALESANFPNVIELPMQAFCGCSRLSSINFPRLQTLGGSVGDGRYFDSCGFVGAISFPNLTTCAGRNAFSGCRGITSFSAPLLTNLSTYMFNQCTSLSSLDIPSVQTIVVAPFDASPIKSLRLPSFVSANGVANNESFRNPQLQLLDLGENTATLNYAFGNAPNLATIIIRAATIPTLSGTLFTNTPFASNGTGGTLYIKKTLYDHLGDGTADDYLNATNWSVILAYPNNQILPIEGSPYEVTT